MVYCLFFKHPSGFLSKLILNKDTILNSTVGQFAFYKLGFLLLIGQFLKYGESRIHNCVLKDLYKYMNEFFMHSWFVKMCSFLSGERIMGKILKKALICGQRSEERLKRYYWSWRGMFRWEGGRLGGVQLMEGDFVGLERGELCRNEFWRKRNSEVGREAEGAMAGAGGGERKEAEKPRALSSSLERTRFGANPPQSEQRKVLGWRALGRDWGRQLGRAGCALSSSGLCWAFPARREIPLWNEEIWEIFSPFCAFGRLWNESLCAAIFSMCVTLPPWLPACGTHQFITRSWGTCCPLLCVYVVQFYYFYSFLTTQR